VHSVIHAVTCARIPAYVQANECKHVNACTLVLQDESRSPEDACIQVELCRVSGPASDESGPRTDLVLGFCRLPLRDIRIAGDRKSHHVKLKAASALPGIGNIQAGDDMLELHLDIIGRNLLA
jgi:hypothetical protein